MLILLLYLDNINYYKTYNLITICHFNNTNYNTYIYIIDYRTYEYILMISMIIISVLTVLLYIITILTIVLSIKVFI